MERPYLHEAGFQDYRESMRTLTFEKLKERVRNVEEMMAMIEEREREADGLVGQNVELSTMSPEQIREEYGVEVGPKMSDEEMEGRRLKAEATLEDRPELAMVLPGEADEEAEPQTQEIAIIERVASTHPGYDFYVARRQAESRVFRPETAIVARTRGKIYLAIYEGEDHDTYEAVDEGRFLEETIGPDTLTGGFSQEMDTMDGLGVLAVDPGQDVIGSGGEGAVSPIMYRRKEKMFPEAGVRKESHDYFMPQEMEQLDMVSALGNLMDQADEGSGKQYFVRPLGVAEIEDKPNMLFEMAESEGGVAKNLAEVLDSPERDLSGEQRLTIMLQLFRAQKFLSDRGILHNDIKPGNILLSEDGIKLCDYGMMSFRKGVVNPDHRRQVNKFPEDMNVKRYKKNEFCLTGTPPYVHPKVGVGGERFNHENFDTYGSAVTACSLLTNQEARDWIEGDTIMNFLSNFEGFKRNLGRAVDAALDSDKFKGCDREKLRRLVELIKRSLGPADEDGSFPAPEEFIAALEDLGVSETMPAERSQ
ncbi:protein kinase [Patescibacteria group bacterium]